MSQLRGLSRARMLVLPGRAGDGQAEGVVARMRKLAASRSTGTLPVAGSADGAFYFRDGQVSYAESARTPGRLALAGAGLSGTGLSGTGPAGTGPAGTGPAGEEAPGGAAAGGGERADVPFDRLTAVLAVAEATADAALDLLSDDARAGKFRPGPAIAGGLATGVPVESLLDEVARRDRILGQLAAVLTADTPIDRSPAMAPASVRVSPRQWALLIRAHGGRTPRDLAWELGHSVFGTTTDVYRLMVLRLLAARGSGGPAPEDLAGPAGCGRLTMSFARAAAGPEQRGGSMPSQASGEAT